MDIDSPGWISVLTLYGILTAICFAGSLRTGRAGQWQSVAAIVAFVLLGVFSTGLLLASVLP